MSKEDSRRVGVGSRVEKRLKSLAQAARAIAATTPTFKVVDCPRPEDEKHWFEKTKLKFRECDSCAAKPGTPTLCKGCLQNRDVIYRLKKELKKRGE